MHKARLLAPGRWGGAPRDGVVAVKVQYPNALETMLQDLQNIRVAGRFLSARPLPCPPDQQHAPCTRTHGCPGAPLHARARLRRP